MKSEKFNKYWTIDTKVLLPCYQNKENGYLLHLYENHLFNVAGELTNDEKDLIVEMVKLLRDKTKVDRTKFADFEKAIRNFAQLANPFKNRFSLFHKCIYFIKLKKKIIFLMKKGFHKKKKS